MLVATRHSRAKISMTAGFGESHAGQREPAYLSLPTGGSSAELAWQMTIEFDNNARIVKAA